MEDKADLLKTGSDINSRDKQADLLAFLIQNIRSENWFPSWLGTVVISVIISFHSLISVSVVIHLG
jgi:hypothetical protein